VITLFSEEENTFSCENEDPFVSKIPSIDLLNLVTEQQRLYWLMRM
jgi:hypothetical protein